MEDAIQNRRLVRQANRLQVLVELVKGTADSLADQIGAAFVVEPSGGPSSALPQDPAKASTTSPDPMLRPTVTRGTLLAIVDRIEDATALGNQTAIQGACRDLRQVIDGILL